VRFEVSDRAERQIERIDKRWADERPAATSMFLDELASTERRLLENPELGKFYGVARNGKAVRRILLSKTEYHVYYQYRADLDKLSVISVWSARRGRGPKL
jgi:plasmid stabilization system protein ParE